MEQPKTALAAPPETIYLQYHGDGEPDDGLVRDADVTWCRDKIFEYDVEYVRAERSAPRQGAAQGERLGAVSGSANCPACKQARMVPWTESPDDNPHDITTLPGFKCPQCGASFSRQDWFKHYSPNDQDKPPRL